MPVRRLLHREMPRATRSATWPLTASARSASGSHPTSDVLLLRLVADLTVDQIALVLGKTAGAVKALQRRGFEAVRRIFEREGVPL